VATNFFFNNFESSQEQLLIENLIVESIKIYGMELYYLPRKRVNFDSIYGEDPVSEFNDMYSIEMYIKNVDGFRGDRDFLSKFNLQIRDQVTFTVARRSFNDEVGSEATLERPREGDLIFFPLNNKIFEIKFIEHEAIFYQLGTLQTYDIVCELFEYSNERFNTGEPYIDELYNAYSLEQTEYGILYETTTLDLSGIVANFITDESGNPILLEDPIGNRVIDDNLAIQDEISPFIDFSEKDPFSEGTY